MFSLMSLFFGCKVKLKKIKLKTFIHNKNGDNVASIRWQELHYHLSHSAQPHEIGLFHLRHLTEGGEWCAPNDKEQAIRQSGVKN